MKFSKSAWLLAFALAAMIVAPAATRSAVTAAPDGPLPYPKLAAVPDGPLPYPKLAARPDGPLPYPKFVTS
jgi:hypothetical protein